MWSKVFFPRKQHDGGDQASNHPPSGLKSNTNHYTPLRPHKIKKDGLKKK